MKTICNFGFMVKNRYDFNPFRGDLVVDTRKGVSRVSGGHDVLDRGTGELVGASFVVYKRVDREPFIKLFSGSLDLYMTFSGVTCRLMFYVMSVLGMGDDFVLLRYGVIVDELCLMSRGGYYVAIRELLDAGVIARGMNIDVFWVNPAKLFNGSRMTYLQRPKGG